ncbi:DUF2955 domain-containing protein [Thalassotalea mangrovi]|uniref:DUF2955 domain-containing protein n=1 Tax=Thalassotalea mangrovi TaxID=2572245 RepID=A0A4U1B938_9GAMM|nr:DUF2955 domain-containing protein [Thalassotalea mangrovi]TKB47075.1 DUF2955 domain-containing protein [Thalassotalea mangrovi]
MLTEHLWQNSSNTIRILRLVFGAGLAIAIAFAFNWPLAFLCPVLTSKFLATATPKLPVKTLTNIFLVVVVAFSSAILVTRFLLPFPMVFMLVAFLLIYWLAYWSHSGGNELVITMLLIGFTIIPLLALLHQVIVIEVTYGFIFSCLLALVITMIAHELVPDKPGTQYKNAETAKAAERKLPRKTRLQLAALTTIIIMPVLTLFLLFDLSNAMLILVFVAILAQKPNLLVGIQGAKALLLGNTIGGVVAILIYALLVMVPQYAFLIFLFLLLFLGFGKLIFSPRPLAPIYAMAMTTVIILVSSATLGNADADEKFYMRIIQVAAACGYIIFATTLTRPYFDRLETED